MAPQPANGGIATCPRNRRDIFNRRLTGASGASGARMSNGLALRAAVRYDANRWNAP